MPPRDRVIVDREQDRLADDVMDLVQSADQAQTKFDSAEELEKERRLEHAFLIGMKAGINERLRPAGILCEGVLPNGEGSGYRAYCKDNSGRQYNADLSFEEGTDFNTRFGKEGGPKLVNLVCERILAARATWFRRMGLT